jgi:uncharacterized protein DUF551
MGIDMSGQTASESTVVDLESLRQSVLSLSNPSVTYEELKAAMDGVDALLAEVRAHREREAPGGWIAVSDALPDSDAWVLVASDAGGYSVAELEFTDDSEGHGKPYWAHAGGDTSLESYPHWMPLPKPPVAA